MQISLNHTFNFKWCGICKNLFKRERDKVKKKKVRKKEEVDKCNRCMVREEKNDKNK